MAKKKCVVPKTKSYKNGNGTRSTFSKRGGGKTKAKADSSAKKIRKGGNRARVVEICGQHYVYVGPKKKTGKPKGSKGRSTRRKRA